MFSKRRAQWLEKLRSKEIVNTELHNAILAQRPKDVIAALKKGADPNSRNSSTKEPAIFPVCARGNIEITRILLHGGADPNIIYIYGKTQRLVPLVIAVIYNRTAICKILLEFGANPNGPPELEGSEKLIRQEEKPVYHAAMGGRVAISQVLLKGDWKMLYYQNVKEKLEEVLLASNMLIFNFSEEDLVKEILDFLRLEHVEVDISLITDPETWTHMEETNNPTLKYYRPFHTKLKLQHISDMLEDDDCTDGLTRANVDTSMNLRTSEIYGDVSKLLDEPEE